MNFRIEVVVPKGDTAKVMKAMVDKLTEMGIELVPFHRGTTDFATPSKEALVWIDVPTSFKRAQLQEVAVAINLNITKRSAHEMAS